ncbi:MAG: hypothetical protein MR711_13315 [Selenomonas sp.]|uniref:hypothetical protein n=1 Tax=Selenomonas sp. TaxID=2053611 RepID=UPI0025E5874E|nr:hypothetical protein [Selenomonas sp.]MCI6087198.1 hypothetical protein [Selenomonas sp.]
MPIAALYYKASGTGTQAPRERMGKGEDDTGVPTGMEKTEILEKFQLEWKLFLICFEIYFTMEKVT